MAIVTTVEKQRLNETTHRVPVYVREDTGAPLAALAAKDAAIAVAETATGYTFTAGADGYDATQESDHSYRVEVEFRTFRENLTGVPAPTPPPPIPPLGTAEFSFAYRAQPLTTGEAVRTICWAISDAQNFDGNALDLFHACWNRINLDPDEPEVERVKPVVPPPPVTERVVYNLDHVVIPASYRDTMRSMLGRVNSTEWWGYPAGSMFLAEISGGKNSSGGHTLEFGFSYADQIELLGNGLVEAYSRWHDTKAYAGKRNILTLTGEGGILDDSTALTDYSYGSMDPPVYISGHAYRWSIDRTLTIVLPRIDDGTNVDDALILPYEAARFYAQLYPEADFNELNLPQF